MYTPCAQVPEGFALPGEPLVLEAPVVTGFGRGSRQLGVPTANLDVALLPADVLAALPRGVFFGWAQLDPPPGWPAEDGCVHKMVMNVGRRPTVNEGARRHVAHTPAPILIPYSYTQTTAAEGGTRIETGKRGANKGKEMGA